MNMKGGNSTAVAVARISCRWIRHAVDGSNKEQQAYQKYESIEFHYALEQEKTIALVHWEHKSLAKVWIKHKPFKKRVTARSGSEAIGRGQRSKRCLKSILRAMGHKTAHRFKRSLSGNFLTTY
jgi:hypothetical protein